ncbi:MAG TPA: HEAT repeat domain-containing protein [Acidimicrobiales bacterium]|nr:HEAT repeat domain-containing protein [Acidimicrobiales bacterium]
MPQDKDRKRLVRQSMALTGKRYTEALLELVEKQPRSPEGSDQARRWVGFLGSSHNRAAFALLETLPEDERRVAAIEGLRHANADVRRRSCQLLDDMALTDESISAMTAALDDDDPHVRAAALHSLSCVHCKPDGCALDERALLERGARDPSPVVRAAVIGPLTWRWDLVHPWVVAILEDALQGDTSPKLQAVAGQALERIRDQLRRDRAWRNLPEPLRGTVGRHVGKWVVVSDERVVSAHVQRGQAAKQARGVRHTRRTDPGSGLAGADMYWVAPSSEIDAVPRG